MTLFSPKKWITHKLMNYYINWNFLEENISEFMLAKSADQNGSSESIYFYRSKIIP